MDSELLLKLIEGMDNALFWLIRSFNPDKNWGSVRETAYTLDLLIQYNFALQSSFLWDGINWLLEQRRGDTWMEEQWETAMALKALSKVKELNISDILNAAREWIIHKQDSRDGLWNDELWESSFVLWYFLEAGIDETQGLIRRPMTWLSSVQSKNGSLVVPHYTAFYTILQSYLKTDYFDTGKQLAIKWFMNFYESKKILWSDVCYSNGYALYGLLRNGVEFNPSTKEHLIHMILEIQDGEGSWGEENNEDTYAMLLGLRELLKKEISKIFAKKQLDTTNWDILERGFIQYFQYFDELRVPDNIFEELIKKQFERIYSLLKEGEKLRAFLIFCILLNQRIYSRHENEINEIIRTFFTFFNDLIEGENYQLLYHFIETINEIAIRKSDVKLVNKINKIVQKAIDNLIKSDQETWLQTYIHVASRCVIFLSETERDLDLAFHLLRLLTEINYFNQTIPIFDKIEAVIIANQDSISEEKVIEFIKLIIIASTNLNLTQQLVLADKLYQKVEELINQILKYKNLDVLHLLQQVWFIESFIGYTHPENFWANLLCNAIEDQDAYFSKILLQIFKNLISNKYDINESIILKLKGNNHEKVIQASRIEFSLHQLKNQYKISLRLSQQAKIQAPVRVLDNFYIDQNSRSALLRIFDVIQYFPLCGTNKESCELMIQDFEILGWKVEECGLPPDIRDLIGCSAEELECDLLYFLGRVLFLLLPSVVRDVFLHIQISKETPLFLQLQIDDIGLPWDFVHTGEYFVINEMATGNIIMEPTKYKLIKPIEFGKDKINVLIIGNPLGDLEYTMEEAKVIHDGLVNIYLIDEIQQIFGKDASKQNVIKQLKSGKYQLVHYAGHTVFNDQEPSQSGLVLHNEEILTAHELEEILTEINEKRSYHPIIYLNSCNASKIKDIELEEGTVKFEGICISLLRGGALACVGNYWEVEDEAIQEFSISFYTLLLEGTTVGDALMKSRNLIHKKRINSFSYDDGKKIVYENRSWGSPKLFGEVQMTLIQKQID